MGGMKLIILVYLLYINPTRYVIRCFYPPTVPDPSRERPLQMIAVGVLSPNYTYMARPSPGPTLTSVHRPPNMAIWPSQWASHMLPPRHRAVYFSRNIDKPVWYHPFLRSESESRRKIGSRGGYIYILYYYLAPFYMHIAPY